MNELTPDEHKILVDAIQDSATVVHKGRKDMNERIRELAEQASHQSPDGYPVTIPYSKDFAKKFAKLIVKECAGVGYDASYYECALNVSNKIKQHFGVEE